MHKLADKAADMSAGQWGDFAGQVLFEVGTEVVTAGGAAALTAVKVADKAVDAAKVLNRLDDAIDAAKALEKADDAADAARALDRVKVPKLEMPTKGINKKTKPLNSPDIDKWIKKGGIVDVLEDGSWRYTDWEGNVVDYVNGYPVFKEPHLRQSVGIGKQKGNHTTDYTNAVKQSKKKPPKLSKKKTTWHHHEDGKTMQEVNKKIHKRFTHNGGVSTSKVKKVSLGKK